MQKHVTNDSDTPRYVGGVLIPPGGTRLVTVIESVTEAEQAPADPRDALRTLVASKVTDIVAALPGLDPAQLEQLLELERAKGDKARSTLVEAIELARLERLSQQEGGEGDNSDPATDPAGEGEPEAGDA